MDHIDLQEIPTQRDDALRVKENLEIVITQPVELVQGGTNQPIYNYKIEQYDKTYYL
jgi:sensor domain CHASE-containing protein